MLRFTNDPNVDRGVHGTRVPYVKINRNTNLAFFTSLINDTNYPYEFQPITLNQLYHVEIHQRYISNGDYRYQVIIDGKIEHTAINKQARQYYNVHVYVSDPLKEPFNGYVGNLKFTNFL